LLPFLSSIIIAIQIVTMRKVKRGKKLERGTVSTVTIGFAAFYIEADLIRYGQRPTLI
jgi:hypothetical protein